MRLGCGRRLFLYRLRHGIGDGFHQRVELLLRHTDGGRRLWLCFEIVNLGAHGKGTEKYEEQGQPKATHELSVRISEKRDQN
jgi:hypothetical protein